MKRFFYFLSLSAVLAMSVVSCSNGAKAQSYDSYTQEVVKLLDVTDAKTLMKTGIVTTVKSILSERQAKSIADEVVAEIWDDYILDCSQVYQKYYTIDELKEVNAFYATPTGAKLAKYTNTVAQDIAYIVQEKYSATIQSIVLKNME